MLTYKYFVMSTPKIEYSLDFRAEELKKGKSVLFLKSEIDTRNQNIKASKKGPVCVFRKSENLLELFYYEHKKQPLDLVVVDECHFLTAKQVEQIREVAEVVPVYAFGLKTNFKGLLFDGSKRFLELSDKIEELKTKCECGNPAILNGRFTKGFLDVDGEEILLQENVYRGMCYACYKKEQRRSLVHREVEKYLKIFKDKKSAGVWSTDTARDSMVVERPFVIYDDDVKTFVKTFEDFKIENSDNILVVEDNIAFLEKLKVSDKDSDYMLTLLNCVFRMEQNKPGMLKTIIESGIMTKWLKQIKKKL